MGEKVLIAKVLDKLVKEVDNRLTWEIWKTGEIVLLKANIKQSIKCKDVERAVELALQMSKENKVPVVSTEWLEKWCKENQDYFFKPHHNDLLSAVRKQAGVGPCKHGLAREKNKQTKAGAKKKDG